MKKKEERGRPEIPLSLLNQIRNIFEVGLTRLEKKGLFF